MEKIDPAFYTATGYKALKDSGITESMEDYLEMICRDCRENGYIRINTLSQRLHVKPSSASKMAAHLREAGLIEFEKYGIIRPSEAGWRLGGYLLHRHQVLADFFAILNRDDNQLEQVEQIEHFIERKTISNLELLNHFLKDNEIYQMYLDKMTCIKGKDSLK